MIVGDPLMFKCDACGRELRLWSTLPGTRLQRMDLLGMVQSSGWAWVYGDNGDKHYCSELCKRNQEG